jgi:putative addiction module component (TIGR02574 family)
MSTNLEAIEAEALKLAPSDRSHLLEKLIASLDVDPEVEAAWALEADRRESEIESGASVAIPGPEVVARLRARLAR